VKALAALLLAIAAASVAAQPWPSRPVRIVVPYPPGGTVDVVARTVAQQLSTQVGQQFVIENRAGASGTLGSEAVAKSVPDGYTLLCNASIFVINPFIMERVPFDVVKDFTAIVNIGQVPLLVAAHPALPAPSLKEFVALARAEPGRYSFATSGIGSAGHLTVEMLRREAGLQSMLIVPYKGTGPALTDLIGGQVHVMADPMPSSFPHVKAGRLKALAQTGKMRAPFLTDVPTVAESGFPGFEMVSWYGLWGPAGLPPQVARTLAAETAKAIAAPLVQERLASQGFIADGSGPEAFLAYIKAEMAKYDKVVREAKIRPQP
jgi:tripartite-type tricarboxylate transporter receptor subunit TctC